MTRFRGSRLPFHRLHLSSLPQTELMSGRPWAALPKQNESEFSCVRCMQTCPVFEAMLACWLRCTSLVLGDMIDVGFSAANQIATFQAAAEMRLSEQ